MFYKMINLKPVSKSIEKTKRVYFLQIVIKKNEFIQSVLKDIE